MGVEEVVDDAFDVRVVVVEEWVAVVSSPSLLLVVLPVLLESSP